MTRNDDVSPRIGGGALLRSVARWATPEEFQQIAILVGDEPEWVLGPPCRTPRALLEAYGLDDDDGRGYNIPRGLPAVLIITHILRRAHGWGEFIGGVLASFDKWEEAERVIIRPALMRAVDLAGRSGVDH
jgi:hypothetical protein